MYRQLLHSSKLGARGVTTPIIYKNYANAAPAVENQRLQNLEQKFKEAAASKPDNWDSARPFSEIPGPKPLPLLGNMWRFLPFIGNLHGKEQIELFTELKEYGDVAVIRGFLRGDLVILRNPEDFESVYRNEGHWPERITFQSVEYYHKHIKKDIYEDLLSIANSNGKAWQKTRSMANPILNQIRSIEMYIPEIDRVAQDFVKRVRYLLDNSKDGIMPKDFLNELNKWSLESVCFVGLNKRLGCLENNLDPNSEAQIIIDSVHSLFEMLYRLEFQPSFWKYYNTKDWKQFLKSFGTIIDIFERHILEAKANFEKNPEDEKNKSMLQRFLSVDEKFAIVMALDLLSAGVDTTGKTTGSILYFLSTHKRAQDELRKELVTLLPEKGTPITKQILTNAKYLKAAVKEGLRMGGIAPAHIRVATKDMVVAGYQIPKGTMVQMIAFDNLFSDKQFPRPKEFIPERWLRSNKTDTSQKNAHPFSYIPFGFGPRTCIGKSLATMEMELLVARVIRNFELEWPHKPARFSSRLLYEIADPQQYKVKEIQQ